MNEILKFIYHKLNPHPKQWHPLLSVYYLTYACNFRCPYCSDGSGKPYYTLPNKTLSADKVFDVMKAIRKNCNSIVITGGEPLNHPDFSEIISRVSELKFKEVVLTTNGHNINEHIDCISKNVTNLVFSIDTLNAEKADENFGVGAGAFNKILNNIQLAKRYSPGNFSINISSVVTPNNIEDLYSVYEYSLKNEFTFAVAPHLEGVKANTQLQGNSEYYRFYDFLIGEKKKGGNIFGSALYLEYMRDLKKFSCRPFTMLVVSPLGDVFYPCLEIGNYAGKIDGLNSLHQLKRMGEKKFGLQPKCDTRCHSACALSFSLLLKHPVSQLKAFV